MKHGHFKITSIKDGKRINTSDMRVELNGVDLSPVLRELKFTFGVDSGLPIVEMKVYADRFEMDADTLASFDPIYFKDKEQ